MMCAYEDVVTYHRNETAVVRYRYPREIKLAHNELRIVGKPIVLQRSKGINIDRGPR